MAVTPIDEYDIGAGAAGAAAGVAGVGAAIAVPGGAGEVGVGAGVEVGRGGRRDRPGGTFSVGVPCGGAGTGARMSSEAVCSTVLVVAPGETALARFAEAGSRFDLPGPATEAPEASRRCATSRVTTQVRDARFRTGFDWSIFTPGLPACDVKSFWPKLYMRQHHGLEVSRPQIQNI